MKGINFVRLIISVGISLLAGVIGSAFTFEAIPTWYALLEKPFFNPPNWIFGPVWTLLYIVMGISFYLIWETNISKKNKRIAFILFFTQLILNTLWSILFFGLKSPFLAFIEILVLLFVLLFTIISFYRISKTAGLLLIPYILWVTFATLLNFSIWILN